MNFLYSLLFLLFLQIKCKSNSNDIKENINLYIVYILIFIISSIITISIFFLFRIKKNCRKICNSNKFHDSFDSLIRCELLPELLRELLPELLRDTFYFFLYLGKIIMTFLSIEVFFFIINILIQSILIFPPIIEEIKSYKLIYSAYAIYFYYVYFSSYVFIIPFYEFFNVPFLKESNPFSHLYSFIYINTSEFNNKNNDIIINIILSIIGFIFSIFYISSYFCVKLDSLKDYLEVSLLFCLLIYYTSLILSYFLYFLFFIAGLCNKTIQFIYKNGISTLPDINLIKQYLIYNSNKKNKNNLDNLINNESFVNEEGGKDFESNNKRQYCSEIMEKIKKFLGVLYIITSIILFFYLI